MIRTLKIHLAKHLIRDALLATLAITVVMTVLAFIEPLRKQGLSGIQALKFLGYVLPLMFSLTLPFSALFAATIVYGRFAQDNELLACRASGVCTLSLLRPAMWLGTLVTVVTLALGLYIAPHLLGLSEKAAKNDLRQMAFYKLRKRQYFDYGKLIFHADEAFPDSGWVKGAVGVDFSNPDNVRCMTAASAKLVFREIDGKTVVIFHGTNPAVFRQDGGSVAMEDRQGVRVGELPSMKDKPKMYDWTRLWQTRAKPADNAVVTEALERVKRKICLFKFYLDVVATVRSQHRYDRLSTAAAGVPADAVGQVEIEAPNAGLYKGAEVALVSWKKSPKSPDAAKRLVVVREFTGQRLRRELRAREGRVRGVWDTIRSAPIVSLTLIDVQARYPGETWDEPRTMEKVEIGPFAVPADIVASANTIDLMDLYRSPEKYKAFPDVVREIKDLKMNVVPKLLAKVQAEIHQRLAYGLSCVFMVMLGAALGLLLRGGQMLSAVAISTIPAALVMVMILMGRQLISNPNVPAAYGIVTTWGGLGALVALTGYVYLGPMRR